MEDQAHDEQHHYAVPLFILFAVAAAVTWIVYQKPRRAPARFAGSVDGSSWVAIPPDSRYFSPAGLTSVMRGVRIREYDADIRERVRDQLNLLGQYCAANSGHVLLASAACAAVALTGLAAVRIETDVLRLFSTRSLGYRAFSSTFAPPHDVHAVITSISHQRETLEWLHDLESLSKDITVSESHTGWSDVCSAPCDEPVLCFYGPWEVDVPRCPENPRRQAFLGTEAAAVATWTLNAENSAEWERAMRDALLEVSGYLPHKSPTATVATRRKDLGLHVSVASTRSLDDELASGPQLSIFLVAAAVIGASLWRRATCLSISTRRPWYRLYLGTKFGLGVFGVILIMIGTAAGFGLVGALGVPVDVFSLRIVPMIVLLTSTDGISVLSEALEDAVAHAQNIKFDGGPSESELDDEHYCDSLESESDAVGEIHIRHAPQVFSDGEVPQLIGTALKNGGINIMLHTVVSVILLLGFLNTPVMRHIALHGASAIIITAALQCTAYVAALAVDTRMALRHGANQAPKTQSRGLSRRTVTMATLVILFFSASCARCICVGFDASSVLPTWSYLHDALAAGISRPVYFVTQTDRTLGSQCGHHAACERDSLVHTVESHGRCIVSAVDSWADAYIEWLDPGSGCCMMRNGTYCEPHDQSCTPCMAQRTEGAVPTTPEHVSAWLNATAPGCASGQAYSDAVRAKYSYYLAQQVQPATRRAEISSIQRFAADAGAFAYATDHVFTHANSTVLPIVVYLCIVSVVIFGGAAWAFPWQVSALLAASTAVTTIAALACMAQAKVEVSILSLLYLAVCICAALIAFARVARAAGSDAVRDASLQSALGVAGKCAIALAFANAGLGVGWTYVWFGTAAATAWFVHVALPAALDSAQVSRVVLE